MEIPKTTPSIQYPSSIMRSTAVTLATIVTASLASALLHAADLEITRDTTLDPQQTYGKLIIKASNVTLDGRGAWLVGSKGEPRTFKDAAITASGVSNVTIKNVNAKGWETGLAVRD